MKHLPFFFLLPILILAGCKEKATSYPDYTIEEGVSLELAQHRKATISELEYELTFDIPAEKDSSITGKVVLRFQWNDPKKQALQIDFDAPESAVTYAANPKGKIDYKFEKGHLIISPDHLSEGFNDIGIDFVAGNGPLNRNDEFLYTLFVPDRAHEAFPCFDQPNLKAKYRLKLNTPESWTAVANGEATEAHVDEGRHKFQFAVTEPISTYLFSFAAGEFETIARTENGREMVMFHRESDSAKVARNLDAVFELHFSSLAWLEKYTGVEYPFEKFAYVLIPSFQYGGMEHPGAILYRAAGLLLEENATQDEQLRRASLIAHETAHMWFGDLVTMDWFDDVWLKEVFANFMAAKIVNPSFPEINHPLRFFLAHYPSAYAVDRSEGTHPIRQNLPNLKDAGSLYGAIIYKKAPIVMRQLELLIGEKAMQEGLQEYLGKFAFGNATWTDLVTILDGKTETDLKAWSKVWVEEAGRPDIEVQVAGTEDGKVEGARMRQSDPSGEGKTWPQYLEIVALNGKNAQRIPVTLDNGLIGLGKLQGQNLPDLLLPNGGGFGYGNFVLDAPSLDFFRANFRRNLSGMADPMQRGVALVTLWDAVLEGKFNVEDWMEVLLEELQKNENPQVRTRALAYLSTTFWRFLTAEQRLAWAGRVEAMLVRRMTISEGGARLAFFRSYRKLVISAEGLIDLKGIWVSKGKAYDLALGERDVTALAFELALRQPEQANAILDQQAARIENPDRKARFEFVRPALSADAAVRDRMFESLRDPANRTHEPWALSALRYLNHPLRAATAEKYLLPSLELLEEIQQTGDIFFPGRWIEAAFSGHQSAAAAQVVRDFLQARPDYPLQLKRKILQGTDLLLRVARVQAATPA